MGKVIGLLSVAAAFVATPALAAEGNPAFIINTLTLMIMAFLVMIMALGFAMLEAGMVQSKNVGVILTKNIGLYSIAGLAFYLAGYNLMYNGVDGGFIGTFGTWFPMEDYTHPENGAGSSFSIYADWFFQMVFVATTASIISGALAERIKLWPFLFFVVILTSTIYPIAGAWVWGGGWLAEEWGFKDFAGSTVVHSVGGWAALAGTLLLGPRLGRFTSKEKRPSFANPSSYPLITLGTFVLWFGWFGFNAGSNLAFNSESDAMAIARICVNTNAAAAAGVLTMMVITQIFMGRVSLSLTLNGALAGLVAITAEPLNPSVGGAIVIGSIGALVMAFIDRIVLERWISIDDVVGAIPVHLGAGIWGTIAVVFSNPEANITSQLVGIAAIGAFTFTVSYVIWFAAKHTIGIRLQSRDETIGGDLSELGITAYDIQVSERQLRTE